VPDDPRRDPARFDQDADLIELRRLAERVRPGDLGWEAPPPAVWDRIAAEIGIGARLATSPIDDDQSPPPAVTASNARRRWWPAMTAAAAAAVIVAVAAYVVTSRDDDADVVAATALERVGPRGSGTAELVERDGVLELRVETAGLDTVDGFFEVWLADANGERMISLGPTRPDGVYAVPAGIDVAEFPVVDVSAEPFDGDPAHSGTSVLRGELPL